LSIDIHNAPFDSPREILELLQSNGLTTKKRFGQNFLVNNDARRRIIEALRIQGGETVWEIGPGIGSLTATLAQQKIGLTVFEIDHGFVRVLQQMFSEGRRVTIVEGDFIKTWPAYRDFAGEPDLIVGNLPYSCSTAIFLSLIECGISAKRIVCTVQKEAAVRMTALPGNPEYSSFSALCGLTWRIERIGDLQAGSFFPRPRVRSTIIALEPRVQSHPVSPEVLLSGTRALFAGRRKTIRNNLKMAVAGDESIAAELYQEAEQSGFDLSSRPETLAPEEVADLAVILSKYMPPTDNGLR